jgi:hypothetical protein
LKKPTTTKARERKTKEPKPAKADKTQKRVEAAKAAAGSNSVDPKVRELFEHHLKKVHPIVNRMKSLNGDLRSLYKTAKADGFTSDQFLLAMKVRNIDGTENVEGVDKLKEKMRRDGATLLYIGSALGTQFGFDLSAPAPSADESLKVAYDAGVNCSKADNAAKTTDYAPDSKQMQEFLRGFHDNEAKKLAGMKTLKPVGDATEAAPTSGQTMTRAQYREQQEKLAAQGEGSSTH